MRLALSHRVSQFPFHIKTLLPLELAMIRKTIVTLTCLGVLAVAAPAIGGEAAKDVAGRRPLSAGEIVNLAVAIIGYAYFFFPEVFAAIGHVLARGKREDP
jgi:hypothetical protein